MEVVVGELFPVPVPGRSSSFEVRVSPSTCCGAV